MGKFDDIYEELGIAKKNENSMVKNLLKVPPKEKKNIQPHTVASKIFASEQLDTLYLPDDDGYKYLLVIVDIATRKCDAEPMKKRDAKTTINALEKIFKRKVIKPPKRLEVDSGSEFKGDFEKHFKKFFEIFRKETGRHRQQSVVESKNQQIGKIINAKMTADEVNNDEVSREWVKFVPQIVKLLNEHFSYEVQHIEPSALPRTDKNTNEILEIGTKVRIQLDNPIDYVEGKKLGGKFRTGDIRWTKKIGKITRFFIRPDQPVMYQVDDNDNVAYTRPQLQIVGNNEVKPPTTKQTKHYAQEIVSKRLVKGKTYYKIRWEDNDITEQDSKQVQEELPDLLKDFKKK